MPSRQSRLLAIAFLFEGGLILLAWALGQWLGQPLGAKMRCDATAIALGVGITLPMLAGFAVCVRWPVGPLARIQQFSDDVIYPLFAPCSLLELAVLSAFAGIGEEALFRGVIQGLLADWIGTTASLLIASAAFGLLHFITLTYAIFATLLGLYLGGLLLATDNLVPIMLAHGLYDFLALVWLVRVAPSRN
jgi:uncharacterized protein